MKAVPGEGDPKPFVLFVGEGPGRNEDREGRPFVGRAGKLLDELLASIRYRRSDVFITNIIKCRPPDNRDPLPPEIEACHGYLDRQIELLSPTLIVTLGRYALRHFIPDAQITSSRGKTFRYRDRTLLALYHPAAGLRNPRMADHLRQDFRLIPDLVRRTLAGG